MLDQLLEQATQRLLFDGTPTPFHVTFIPNNKVCSHFIAVCVIFADVPSAKVESTVVYSGSKEQGFLFDVLSNGKSFVLSHARTRKIGPSPFALHFLETITLKL